VRPVQLADSLLVDQLDREVAVGDPRGGERGERRPAQALRGADQVELDQPCC
jgi:hypothetical protein